MEKETFEISKEFAWEMAHRLLNHDGKCRHLHGHSYRAVVAVQGELNKEKGISSEGMVIDFSELKPIKKFIDNTLDHRCMLQSEDPLSKHLTKAELYPVEYRPTAENIARNIALLCKTEFSLMKIKWNKIRVTVWETAKCSASAEITA